jgi:lysine 2,3-aminomutase
VPTFVVDSPHGGGKVPVTPTYVISSSDHRVVLRNYEGFISTYEEPVDYSRHNPATCKFCQNELDESGQRGVSGLLEGDGTTIKPEGFDSIHSRKA